MHPLSVPRPASHCVDFRVCARPVSHVFLLQPTHTELSRLPEVRGNPWQVAFAAEQLFSPRCLLEPPTSLSFHSLDVDVCVLGGWGGERGTLEPQTVFSHLCL